jgi:sugar O-acyltransferase (sialic acid O-acetyltransferase NeuD family)
MKQLRSIVILGGGGHASVLADLIALKGWSVEGFVAPENNPIKGFSDIPYLGNDRVLFEKGFLREVYLINGIGAISPEGNIARFRLYTQYKNMGYDFLTLIHPSAMVAKTAQIGEGVQIMAGVVIQPNIIICANTIINTRASIDHDCQIGHSVHVAPGVTLSGNVTVNDHALIGVGSTVIQGISIGEQAMVCAGSVVVSNIESCEKVKG